MSFFDRVSAGIAMRGMTIATLARLLEISTQSIYNWQSWDRCKLKAENLIELSKVLELNPVWLYDGSGTPSPSVLCIEAKELCDIYTALPGQSKEALISMAKALLAAVPEATRANPFPRKTTN